MVWCRHDVCVHAASIFGDCGDPVSYQGYDYAQCSSASSVGSRKISEVELQERQRDSYGPERQRLAEHDFWCCGCVWRGSSPCAGDSVIACYETWSLNEYGRLYNWHAVDDARGLCPIGWHVPTDGEWTMMTDHLGGVSIAGGQMKTDYGWYNGGNGTNSSGFAGLPGGQRSVNGAFSNAGELGLW